MKSFAEVIDAFGGAQPFAAALSIPGSHARTMKARDSIPPEYWPEVVQQAASRGVPGVSYELLAQLVAENRGRGAA